LLIVVKYQEQIRSWGIAPLQSGVDTKIVVLFVVLEERVPKQFIGKGNVRLGAHQPKIRGVPWGRQIQIIIAEVGTQTHIRLKTIAQFRVNIGAVPS